MLESSCSGGSAWSTARCPTLPRTGTTVRERSGARRFSAGARTRRHDLNAHLGWRRPGRRPPFRSPLSFPSLSFLPFHRLKVSRAGRRSAHDTSAHARPSPNFRPSGCMQLRRDATTAFGRELVLRNLRRARSLMWQGATLLPDFTKRKGTATHAEHILGRRRPGAHQNRGRFWAAHRIDLRRGCLAAREYCGIPGMAPKNHRKDFTFGQRAGWSPATDEGTRWLAGNFGSLVGWHGHIQNGPFQHSRTAPVAIIGCR